MKNKKGQLELSIGTIVVLVVGVSMLILGIILVRSIMCSGLQMTKDLSTGVSNEIQNLFGQDKLGVKCAGEGGQQINLGTGGQRDVTCVIKTENQVTYDIQVTNIESLSGAQSIDSWIIDKGFTGEVKPAQDKSVVYLSLDIPRDAPKTKLKVTLTVADKTTSSSETIITYLNVVPTGFIKGAIC